MPYFDNAKELMLTELAGVIDQLSIHDDVPDGSGSNEITGGSYARKTPTWAAASDGEVALDEPVVFDIPAEGEVLYIGLWASSGPTFYGYLEKPTNPTVPEVFTEAGTFTLGTGTKHRIIDPS